MFIYYITMTFSSLGTVNVLGTGNSTANYIVNNGQPGPLLIGTNNNTQLALEANGNQCMVISPTGNTSFTGVVTIPTLSSTTIATTNLQVGPTAPGAIKARFSNANSVTITNYAYYNTAGMGTLNNPSTSTYCAQFDNRILCYAEINMVSDERKKRDIADIDPMDAIALIERIAPVTYKWKDESKGTETHYGFIAQDVERATKSLELPPMTTRLPDPDNESESMLVIDKDALLPIMMRALQFILAKHNK